MPFRELKIDKMFVDNCDTDRDNRIVMINTIELAQVGIVRGGRGHRNPGSIRHAQRSKLQFWPGVFVFEAFSKGRFQALVRVAVGLRGKSRQRPSPLYMKRRRVKEGVS
jgi:hypothetical protein